MHLRYANDCVLSLGVTITGIHILSGIEKSRPLPIGAGEIDGMPDASKAELRVKVPQIWRHFLYMLKKVREKSRECHNHKPQPFSDIKRKPTNQNKHKSIKHTKSTKISSLLPKRGNRNAKRTQKQKNKLAQGKTYNTSPRRINHKAQKSKTNTGTTTHNSIK